MSYKENKGDNSCFKDEGRDLLDSKNLSPRKKQEHSYPQLHKVR